MRIYLYVTDKDAKKDFSIGYKKDNRDPLGSIDELAKETLFKDCLDSAGVSTKRIFYLQEDKKNKTDKALFDKLSNEPDVIIITSQEPFKKFKKQWNKRLDPKAWPIESGKNFLRQQDKAKENLPKKEESKPKNLSQWLLFAFNPNNYALMMLATLGFALVISSGLIAGSVVAAVATATVFAGLTLLSTLVFAVVRAVQDKAEKAAAIIALETDVDSKGDKQHVPLFTYDATRKQYVPLAASNYSWSDWFFGPYELKKKAPSSAEVKDAVSGYTMAMRKGLFGRLFRLFVERPVRAAIAVAGIVLFATALVFGVGYLTHVAFIGAIAAPVVELLMGTLAAGFAGMASVTGVATISPVLLGSVSVALLVLAPLVVADLINRFITAGAGDDNKAKPKAEQQDDSKQPLLARDAEDKAGKKEPSCWEGISASFQKVFSPSSTSKKGQIKELKFTYNADGHESDATVESDDDDKVPLLPTKQPT